MPRNEIQCHSELQTLVGPFFVFTASWPQCRGLVLAPKALLILALYFLVMLTSLTDISSCIVVLLNDRSAPMAISAHDEMKLFWKKNLELKRPNSPWWIYRLYLMFLLNCHWFKTEILHKLM